MKLIIFGCGGHARSVMNTITDNGEAADIVLVDDNAALNEKIMGFSVVRSYELTEGNSYIVAVGDNTKRKMIYEGIINRSAGSPTSIVSRLAHIGQDAVIGNGTIIAPYAYVGPQAQIGDDTIINTGSIIEHETTIGNHTHIAPKVTVCGRSHIGDNVFCGAGSTVIDHINICSDVIIGAGAVVVSDISEPGTYVGIPARKIG